MSDEADAFLDDSDTDFPTDFSGNCFFNCVNFCLIFFWITDGEIDSIINDLQDYSPFPSKLFASLYCLLNSPKPMVCLNTIF